MALSKRDRAFYEEKLNWKSVGYLVITTALVGAVAWPVFIFLQDWSIGQSKSWTFNIAYDLAVMGFLLGTVVATVLFLSFKFLLSMGWLPSRN